MVWEGFLEEEGIPEASPKQREEGDILGKHTATITSATTLNETQLCVPGEVEGHFHGFLKQEFKSFSPR